MMISSDKTLTTFLCHAIAANRSERKTLTLVLPERVRLRPAFYCDLAESWHSLRRSPSIDDSVRLQIDCCEDSECGGFWKVWLCAVEQFRCRRAIAQRGIRDSVLMSRCLVISRPIDPTSTIVLGVAEAGMTLPEWTTPATFYR